mmetsp:Transcript_77090/g.226120  ORF Transcript_77090/g.226120 Transcript_77090/m.226120 type:complete len:275 (-) Transcript_77090:52-876(-)
MPGDLRPGGGAVDLDGQAQPLGLQGRPGPHLPVVHPAEEPKPLPHLQRDPPLAQPRAHGCPARGGGLAPEALQPAALLLRPLAVRQRRVQRALVPGEALPRSPAAPGLLCHPLPVESAVRGGQLEQGHVLQLREGPAVHLRMQHLDKASEAAPGIPADLLRDEPPRDAVPVCLALLHLPQLVRPGLTDLVTGLLEGAWLLCLGEVRPLRTLGVEPPEGLLLELHAEGAVQRVVLPLLPVPGVKAREVRLPEERAPHGVGILRRRHLRVARLREE